MKTIVWRRFAAATVLATAGCALQALAQAPADAGAAASSTRGNVYLAGGSVRPAGPVDDDFVAFGGRVVADQPVQGEALLAGGSVDVRAPVADNLRAAGGDVAIDSRVGGELLAAGGNVTLTRSAQVGQGAALAGGLVIIDGKIVGKLRAAARRIVVNGEVTGNARLIAEQIELGPTARIDGALSHASRELKRADGAYIGGPITRDEGHDREHGFDRQWQRQWQFSGPSWIGLLVGYLGLLAAAAVFVLLFPKFSADAPQMVRIAPWRAFALGLGVLADAPLLAVLLFITLLGIPLGIAVFALYPLLALVGYLVGVLFVAQRARAAASSDAAAGVRTTLGYAALALLALALIDRLPVVGALVGVITTIAGIGAGVLEWRRRRQLSPGAAG